MAEGIGMVSLDKAASEGMWDRIAIEDPHVEVVNS